MVFFLKIKIQYLIRFWCLWKMNNLFDGHVWNKKNQFSYETNVLRHHILDDFLIISWSNFLGMIERGMLWMRYLVIGISGEEV